MNARLLIAGGLFALGAGSLALAIRQERLMQQHRQPGVTYRAASLRVDGGWRRSDLFTPTGLAHQKWASTYGLRGIGLWIAALGAWIALG